MGIIGTRFVLPVVVLELVFGILIGPEFLNFAQPDEFVMFFSNLGLGMLFFFAGYEIDFERIKGHPLRLAAIGWGDVARAGVHTRRHPGAHGGRALAGVRRARRWPRRRSAR